MADEFITEKDLEHRLKSIEDENHRQNQRIEALEGQYAMVNQLAIGVERLATNMESMAKELARQGDQLNDVVMQPAKKWDSAVLAAVTTIIGTVIGMLLKGLI